MDVKTPIKKPQKRNTQKGHPGYLADPRKPRDGEAVGSGFIVFRRGGATGRVRCPEYPFEHPSIEAAIAECDRLSSRYPGETFVVFAQTVTRIVAPYPPTPSAESASAARGETP